MGNKIVTEADRKAHSRPQPLPGINTLQTRSWPAREPGTWRCYPQQEPRQALQEGRLKPVVASNGHAKQSQQSVGFSSLTVALTAPRMHS